MNTRKPDRGGEWPTMTPPVVPFTAEVAEYLADCALHAELLSPKYHPTEDSAVKMIFHHGKSQADQIKAAYQAATGTKPEETESPASTLRRVK